MEPPITGPDIDAMANVDMTALVTLALSSGGTTLGRAKRARGTGKGWMWLGGG